MSGCGRGEDGEHRGAQYSVTDQFHTSQLGAQQTADQLCGNVSVEKRAEDRTTKFRAPVEFARLQSGTVRNRRSTNSYLCARNETRQKWSITDRFKRARFYNIIYENIR